MPKKITSGFAKRVATQGKRVARQEQQSKAVLKKAAATLARSVKLRKGANDHTSTTARLFLEFSRETWLQQYWPRLRSCVESLSDQQIWWRPNEASNSIGNLLLHLDGNVRQWLLASFSQIEDKRNRPAEFNERRQISRAQLIEQLAKTMDEVSAVLSRLTEAELTKRYEIQGYKVSGVHAVYHVVEHFGMHYGQITYVTKMLRSQDLNFYPELQKTGRAS